MTDQPLDDDLRTLKELDDKIERLLGTPGDGEGPRGQARIEVDQLIDQRSQLLQRINRETPSSSDDFDRGPRGSGPRPAG